MRHIENPHAQTNGPHHRERFFAIVDGEEIETGQRLDRFLTSKLTDLSRSSIQHLIVEGEVLVNGHPSKPGYALRKDDTIALLSSVSAKPQKEFKPLAVALDIVYEDKDLVIVNKAAGMVVHPAPGHYEDTLVNALLARYPELSCSEDMRPGIVHRLDKDTSGLMIVARNTHAHSALVEQMKNHQVVKRYLALVEGNIALDRGSIDAPVGRDPRHRQQMTITATEGREARTHFRVLERFARHTLLLLQLETGRTHQIRVHLQGIGHPLVGDPTYGSKKQQLPLHRQFLHAYQLEFAHPTTGKHLAFEASLPDELQHILTMSALL